MIFFFLFVYMYMNSTGSCTYVLYSSFLQYATFALTRQTQFVHALLSPFLDFLAVSRPFPKQLADGALQCLKLGQ